MAVKKPTPGVKLSKESELEKLVEISQGLALRLLHTLKATGKLARTVPMDGFVRSLLPLDQAKKVVTRLENFRARAIKHPKKG